LHGTASLHAAARCAVSDGVQGMAGARGRAGKCRERARISALHTLAIRVFE